MPTMTQPMDGMTARWIQRQPMQPDQSDPSAADPQGLIERLLAIRGVTGADRVRHFLRPRLHDLHDPALLPGVEAGAARLAQAARAGQPIIIYGDYDVDGVTASAILYHTLREAGARARAYVPHRVDEGYGLHTAALQRFAAEDPRPLVVTVDCGITATAPAAAAGALGLELVITDHHHFDPAALPEAAALVHPGLAHETTGEAYPCEHLCGAGVAFKLAWHFARRWCGSDRLPARFRDLMAELLSLVALGTVADVVPLRGENRVLTVFGLGRIKATRFAGLRALIEAAGLMDESIGAYHVGFVLGPRLNACGRMGHAAQAVRLLTTAQGAEAQRIAAFLTRENDRRRATQRAIFQDAQAMAEDEGHAAPDRRAIVLAKEGWHPGVIGIVASRLVEQYSRPVVMLALRAGGEDQKGGDREAGGASDDAEGAGGAAEVGAAAKAGEAGEAGAAPAAAVAQGSARSVEAVHLHRALSACADHLSRFGGHAMAAGMTLPADHIPAFREALNRAVTPMLDPEQMVPTLGIDAPIDPAWCTLEVFDRLEALAPFGRGNPKPRLLLRGVILDRSAQLMGAQGKHLALWLGGVGGGRVMRAVGFGLGHLADRLPRGQVVDVVFTPSVDQWRGRRRAELHIQDLRRADPPAHDKGKRGQAMLETPETA